MVPERPLRPGLARLHVALKDELRRSRHLQVHRPALHQVHGCTLDETGQQHLVHPLGHGGGGRIGNCRGGADGHRHLHAPPLPLVTVVVVAAVLVNVPVHAGGVSVVDLHAIHPHVPPSLHALGEHHRQGHEPPPILGPALQHGDRPEIDLVSGQDHLLAWRSSALSYPRQALCQPHQLWERSHLTHEGCGHGHLQQP
ncbi:MAG: hypothetical protein A4E29_01593 [Methanomassiliicoccales archaeon PtaB.Bin134]|nr:MAG: hypothetical protein A4E29_01593 [Methanomassiliicoccales archaeon PtaB.Bin134]